MNLSEKYVQKRLLKMFFDRRWSLDGVKTLIKIPLTLSFFAVGWALCCRPQLEHESVMPLLSLSPLSVLIH